MIRDSFKIIAVTFGLLLSIEAVLQVVYLANTNSDSSKEPELAYQHNADYLIELIPNTEKLFVRTEVNGGDSILWKVNSDGFRGSELQINPDKRIMVYGDSNVQARFSEEDSTFVQKIGRYLRTEDRQDIELINSGVIGFGPDQSLLKFEEEVKLYDPDLIVFTIFAYNDLGDIIRNRLFELTENDKLIPTDFDNEEDQFLKQNNKKFQFQLPLFVENIRSRLLPRSEDVDSKDYKDGVYNYYKETNEKAFKIYERGGRRKFSNFEDPFDIDVAVYPDSEPSLTKKKLLKNILERLKELAGKKNVELVVVILPSPVDMTVSNDYLGYEYLQNRFPSYDRKQFSGSIEDMSKELDINTINLFPVFNSNEPESLYFKGGDTHWNDKGQDLAARVTATFIADSVWDN